MRKPNGPVWLFFGHQREASDFFYREEMEAFMARGALLYICGDARRMAADVEKALVEVIGAKGGLDEAAARACVAQMKGEGHYQADVYGRDASGRSSLNSLMRRPDRSATGKSAACR